MREAHSQSLKHQQPALRRSSGGGRANAFTLIQLLIALAILGTLAGLLLVAMSHAKKVVKSAADRQLISGIKTGVTSFVTTFDIAPPLVKDQAKSSPKTIDTQVVDSVTISTIAVYVPGPDQNFLRGANLTITLTNPLAADDHRYSIDSLGIYLAGALNAPQQSTKDIPIDLQVGLGTGRPTLTGTFEKGKFGPFVEAESKSLSISRSDDKTMPRAILQDSNKVPIRYYRWMKNKNITKWDDLNIPPMVIGPDYALYHSSTPAEQRKQTDTKITGANWAIVMAGANRVFGDEPLPELVKALRTSGANVDDSMSETSLRALAWEDNLVEADSAPN